MYIRVSVSFRAFLTASSSPDQALILGRHVRQQLVHAVREEYEQTVREIERGGVCGSSPYSITGSTIHWPKSGRLCFPVFLEEGETVRVQREGDPFISHPQPQCESETSCPTLLKPSQECRYPLPEVDSGKTSSSLELQNCSLPLPKISHQPRVDQERQCSAPSSAAMCTPFHASLSERDIVTECNQNDSESMPCDISSAPKTDILPCRQYSASLEGVSSPSLSSLSSSSSSEGNTLGGESRGDGEAVVDSSTDSTKESCTLQKQSRHDFPKPDSVLSSRPGEAVCVSESAAGTGIPAEQTSPQNLGDLQNRPGETCDGMQHEPLLGSGPVAEGSFPKDRHSLLELRSETAMELVWLKQAIVSRQKVLCIYGCVSVMSMCVTHAERYNYYCSMMLYGITWMTIDYNIIVFSAVHPAEGQNEDRMTLPAFFDLILRMRSTSTHCTRAVSRGILDLHMHTVDDLHRQQ